MYFLILIVKKLSTLRIIYLRKHKSSSNPSYTALNLFAVADDILPLLWQTLHFFVSPAQTLTARVRHVIFTVASSFQIDSSPDLLLCRTNSWENTSFWSLVQCQSISILLVLIILSYFFLHLSLQYHSVTLYIEWLSGLVFGTISKKK